MTRSALVVSVGACLVALWSSSAQAQSMLESVRTGWSTFVFVSADMPRTMLVELAREASSTHAKLVLRGFRKPGSVGDPLDMQGTGALVAGINAECCKDRGAGWLVDPRLFDRYGIRSVPAFVVAWGEGAGERDYSRVSGEMSVANALKFFAQQSSLPAIRSQASAVYTRAFGGQP